MPFPFLRRLSFSFVVLLLMAACGKKNTESRPQAIQAPPATAPTTAAAPPLPVLDGEESDASAADRGAQQTKPPETQDEAQLLCDAVVKALAHDQVLRASMEEQYQRQSAAHAEALAAIMQDSALSADVRQAKMAELEKQCPVPPAPPVIDPKATETFDALFFQFRAAVAAHRDDEARLILRQMAELAPKVNANGVKLFWDEARLAYPAPKSEDLLPPEETHEDPE